MTQTVNHYIEVNLAFRPIKTAPSTLRSERSKAATLSKLIGHRDIALVTHSDVLKLIQTLNTRYANKTINEFLIILRAVFHCAERDGVISNNPMTNISNLKVFHEEPQPFTLSELALMSQAKTECESGKNLYQLGVLTGLRISELLALNWESVDLAKSLLHIKIAIVDNIYKTPKTAGSVRKVELCEPAIAILTQQHSITGHKKAVNIAVLQADNKTKKIERLSPVFYNSKTNKPFLHAKQFNKTFFTPLLKIAGVAHRGAGQLRHTFASQALTAGISKEWIAKQLGHTSTAMIDIHYGRWMTQDAPDHIAAVAEQFSSVFGRVNNAKQEVPPSPVSTDLPTAAVNNIQLSEQQLLQLLISHPDLITQHLKMLLSQNAGERLI